MASHCFLFAIAAIWTRAAGVRDEDRDETQPEPTVVLLMKSYALIHGIIDDVNFRTSDFPKKLSEGRDTWGIDKGKADGTSTVFSEDLLEQWNALKAYRDLTVKIASDCGFEDIDDPSKESLRSYEIKVIEKTTDLRADHYCPQMVKYITDTAIQQINIFGHVEYFHPEVENRWSWWPPSYYFFTWSKPNTDAMSGKDWTMDHFENSVNYVLQTSNKIQACLPAGKSARRVGIEKVAAISVSTDEGEKMPADTLRHFVKMMKDILPPVEMVLNECDQSSTSKLPEELKCMMEFGVKISAAETAHQIKATFDSLAPKIELPRFLTNLVNSTGHWVSVMSEFQNWWKDNVLALQGFDNPGLPFLRAMLVVAKHSVREAIDIKESCKEAARATTPNAAG